GQVVPPHIFTKVTRDMDLAKNEVFGPLVGIIRAKDEADALAIANDSMFGLSSAVFTEDMEKGLRFARGIKAGMTHINDISVNDESHVPFGGEGLYWFSVALFIGLLAGTYSSVYIASSIPLRMGLSRDDFVVKVKPEFEEEVVTFNDPKMFEQEQS
uniref:aldehyde dehydrogenase family protein n=1 Tax=Psychrobacter sp. I-STPA6b TaxID=2585718 RepID=UPI001D0C536A